MSFRDLESRCLVPVGNLHGHASGTRSAPGDDLLRRIAAGLGVEPADFREWRERRLVEALRGRPRSRSSCRAGWPRAACAWTDGGAGPGRD